MSLFKCVFRSMQMPIFFLSSDSIAIVIVPIDCSDRGNKIDLMLITSIGDGSNLGTLI